MTPAQVVIRSRNDEIVRSWNRARFRRLAQILNLTEGELADMAYIVPIQFRRHMKENKFPAAVAGHLENIERWVKASKLGVRFKKGTAQDIILKQKVSELTEAEPQSNTIPA